MLSALRRAWYWWCPAVEWRVVKYEDGLWYAEVEHMDQGWVCPGIGHASMIGAAAEGRKLYERKV